MARSKKQAARVSRRGLGAYLHPQPKMDEAPWTLLPWFLAAAFVLRAGLALSGDFVIHPDEIMQYLEQAHRLVFGSGVVYWEFFYGARSWLMPGLAAIALGICSILGLDSPFYYIAAVKLLFCLLSLLIPWGMYVFGRRHFGENTARIALIAGAFWYELVGFAHKPMTEFVATGLLFALLAAIPLSAGESRKRFIAAGILGVLLVAVRFQYAPAAALIMLAVFLRGGPKAKLHMFLAASGTAVIVGLMETITWGAPFYSYYFNFRMNLDVGAAREGESEAWIMPLWLLLSSCGLAVVAVFGVPGHFRRRMFVAAIALLILLPHMAQHHREYRFIFAVIPLWLLLSADVVAIWKTSREWHPRLVALTLSVPVSIMGVLNLLPLQHIVYTGFSRGTEQVNFLFNQDPSFALYRRISEDDSARGVADFTRPYFNTGGYYYLHHNIPLYDRHAWSELAEGEAAEYVTHIITEDIVVPADAEVSAVQSRSGELIPVLRIGNRTITLPAFAESDDGTLIYWNQLGRSSELPQFSQETTLGRLALWKTDEETEVREWESYEVFTAGGLEQVAEKILGRDAPKPPARYGVEFKDSDLPQ